MGSTATAGEWKLLPRRPASKKRSTSTSHSNVVDTTVSDLKNLVHRLTTSSSNPTSTESYCFCQNNYSLSHPVVILYGINGDQNSRSILSIFYDDIEFLLPPRSTSCADYNLSSERLRRILKLSMMNIATVSFKIKAKHNEILDDGFNWTKYGLIRVLNSPHPRSYYKCATQGCDVKKLVERDEDDPTYCRISYRGVHKCSSDPQFLHSSEYLERCLSYCLLFPPGHKFEGDSIVKLWIAEEVIDGKATERLEDKGYICLQLLLSHGYIEQSIIHEDVQFEYKVSEYYANRGILSDDFLIISKDGLSNIPRTPLHLSLPPERFDNQISEIMQTCHRLRTLLLLGDCKYLVQQIHQDLFLSLNQLRTLVLAGTQVSEVPYNIGNLKDLRYFDLSGTIIRYLPGSICDVVSLQTLKLRDCEMLKQLPEGMNKLINLRHLDLDIVRQLWGMPERMGGLVNLQTLEGFIVGTDEECGIGELCRLNNITGSFCISCLENVLNVEEAKKANLRSKSYITKLVLRWKNCISAEVEEKILECLLPHPNLAELKIEYFNGSALPSWISDPSFTRLTSITFFECSNCSLLPRVGKLLSLKFLDIFYMDKVVDIDSMFSDDYEGGFRCFSFPSLEKLIMKYMPQLQKWTVIPTYAPCLHHINITHCPRLVKLPSMSSLNSLKYLQLVSCYELECLPDLPASLETLIIEDCPNLEERCCIGKGRDWPKIAHVPNVDIYTPPARWF